VYVEGGEMMDPDSYIFPDDHIFEAYSNVYSRDNTYGLPWRNRREAEMASLGEDDIVYRIHVIPRRKGNGKE
jgi:hypothetical protein